MVAVCSNSRTLAVVDVAAGELSGVKLPSSFKAVLFEAVLFEEARSAALTQNCGFAQVVARRRNRQPGLQFDHQFGIRQPSVTSNMLVVN